MRGDLGLDWEGSLLSDRTPAHSSRLVGLAGAALLQCGFFLLFLMSMPILTRPVEQGRELVFTLPRIVPAKPTPMSSNGPTRQPRASAPLPVTPLALPAIPPAFVQPDLKSFGQAFNNCAPESYQSLPPEQKALCLRPSEGAKIALVPDIMGTPSHVKDEAYWAAGLAHKQSNVLLPCQISITTRTIQGTASNHGVSLGCIASLLAKEKLTDPRSWPIYETDQLATGDFHAIEQAYDEWHKEHPDAAMASSGK